MCTDHVCIYCHFTTILQLRSTISDQEFETFWPLDKFYHNCYTLGLQIWYSCEYISHEHEYIFYFFIVQLWKLTEASQLSKAIVSGDWNGCHIKVTVNCQILIGWILLTLAFSVHIWSAEKNPRKPVSIFRAEIRDFKLLKHIKLLVTDST